MDRHENRVPRFRTEPPARRGGRPDHRRTAACAGYPTDAADSAVQANIVGACYGGGNGGTGPWDATAARNHDARRGRHLAGPRLSSAGR